MEFFRVQKIKDAYFRNERYLSPLALTAGFIWDNLTLRRIDLWLENLAMIGYLLFAGAAILYLNTYDAGRLRHNFFEKLRRLIPFALQFSFGALFSAFLIFYSKSAAWLVSWPFLLALVGLLVGNEVFRQRYQRLVFQICVYFFALFSYCIFAVPLVLKKIGAEIFVLSGATSLLLIALFFLLLFKINPQRTGQAKKMLAVSIGVIYLTFQVLYFTNVIPPIPLALKEGGVFHQVTRVDSGAYEVRYESSPWYVFFKNYSPTFHWQAGQRVYCFSAIFAPAKIDTAIEHHWYYYDEALGRWTEKDTLSFRITGGRDGGWRGYTYKTNLAEGKWRVDVTTPRGQTLGRIKFELVTSEAPPELKTGYY